MRWISIALLTFLLAGQVIAQDVPAEGAIVKGNLQIGRSTFALPPGEWQVLATALSKNIIGGVPSGADVASVYLVQQNADGTFVASLFHKISLNSEGGNISWNDSLCNRKDTLYRDAFSGGFKHPECLLINHYTEFWVTAPTDQLYRKVWDWYQHNKVKLPNTALSASYRKYFSGDHVSVVIYVNPEVFGQDKALKSDWAESEWNPLAIKEDPKRLAFVENFKKWSYVMAENAKSTLMDRKPKSASLPSLDDLKVK